MRRVDSLIKKNKKVDEALFNSASDDFQWEHEKRILELEFPHEKDIKKMLDQLIQMEEKIARLRKVVES